MTDCPYEIFKSRTKRRIKCLSEHVTAISHLRSFFRTPTQDTMANPVCFFDMTIGGEPAGRIEMTLRADVTPKTAGASPAS